jgi:5-methylcytosine-specific restriction protein A
MRPGGWVGRTRTHDLPPDWRHVIVPRILLRDKGICYLCGAPGADAVDHVNPGNDHRDNNLAAVHERTPPHCHRRKTSIEGLLGYAEKWRGESEIPGRWPGEKHPGMAR